MVRLEVETDWEEHHMLDEVEVIYKMMADAQTTSQEMTGQATRPRRPPTRTSSRLGAVVVPPPQDDGRAPPPTPFLRPPLPSNLPARQGDGTVIQVDEDNVRLPHSFAPALYPHTLGTALLSEPGLEEPPPPPLAENSTNALEVLQKLQDQLSAIQELAKQVKAQVMAQARRLEAEHLGTSAHIAAPVRRYIDWELNDEERVARYHTVNGSPLPYSLATLPPRNTHLQVEEKVLMVAILDFGACSILIGKDFAGGISLLQPD